MTRMKRIELTVLALAIFYQIVFLFLFLAETNGHLKYAKWTTKDGIQYYSTADYQAAGLLLLGVGLVLVIEVVMTFWGLYKKTYLAGVSTAIGMLLYYGMFLQAFYNQGTNLKKHILFAAAGFLIMIIFSFFCRMKLNSFSEKIVISGILLLIISNLFSVVIGVFFTEESVNGAYSWLSFGGISFQPGEFLKAGLIVFAASCYKLRISRRLTAIYITLCSLSVIALVLAKDLGNSSIILMLWIASSYYLYDNWKATVAALGAAAAGLLAAIKIFPHVRERFETWGRALDAGEGQQYDSLMAILKSGFRGCGPAGDTVSATRVTSSSTDYAANVLISIFGIWLLSILILLVLILLVQMYRTPVLSPFHYIIGILSSYTIMAQYFLHCMGNLNCLPLTGICLNYISSGGSNLLMSFLLLGGICISLSPEFIKEKKYLRQCGFIKNLKKNRIIHKTDIFRRRGRA